MWCAQKFISGHNCIRFMFYHILVEDSEDRESEHEVFLDCEDNLEGLGHKDECDGHNPTISLHALTGIEGYQTMRIMGRIKKQSVVILIDSGSTHNFIDQVVSKRLKCSTKPIVGVQVTVANGDSLKSQEICELVRWEAQALIQFTDFLVLPLRGCDLVLGV